MQHSAITPENTRLLSLTHMILPLLENGFRYVGVYTGVEGEDEDRLRLLYDLKDHYGENGEPTYFASLINDYWKNFGGYSIIAGKALADFPETIATSALQAIPQEQDIPGVMERYRSQRSHMAYRLYIVRRIDGKDLAGTARYVERDAAFAGFEEFKLSPQCVGLALYYHQERLRSWGEVPDTLPE